jgi:hypothetical protein
MTGSDQAAQADAELFLRLIRRGELTLAGARADLLPRQHQNLGRGMGMFQQRRKTWQALLELLRAEARRRAKGAAQ